MRIGEDLAAGQATRLVLAIVAEGECSGYAIQKRVRQQSGGDPGWPDGMLYPLLHRLLRLGYVTTEWRTPPGDRRRRYYAITADGRSAIARQRRSWTAASHVLGDVLRGFGGLPVPVRGVLAPQV